MSQINREINYISKSEKRKKLFSQVLYKLTKQRVIIQKDFENYLVYLVKQYQKDILRIKKYFVNLRLELGIKKRRLFAEQDKTKFKDEFSDLDINKIKAAKDMFVWEFKGGFWADELGDYAVAVKSKCKKK